MFKEFKEFAVKGNVADMAVGIIIGGAFGTIVRSLVADILMPPIGLLLGGVDFSNMFIVLDAGNAEGAFLSLAEAKEAGAVTINYGVFINSVVSFLIVAFVVFLVVKQLNRLKRQQQAPPAAPTTKECSQCFTQIPMKALRCPNCTSQIVE